MVTRLQQIASAVFYSSASILIILVNKIVLTSFRFPSFQFLGLSQICATVVLLAAARFTGVVDFPCNSSIPKQVFPLPLIYIGNLVFGLGSTKRLSLPMFTVLRRFSILFTLLLEQFILNVRASYAVKCSVATMIVGALIAASNDLSFDAPGYIFILLNDVTTALNGVYTKKKLEAKEIGKYGLLFYNAVFNLLPFYVLCDRMGDVNAAMTFDSWSDAGFVCCFLGSAVMGFVLNYSVVLCTAYNSALTTTIIGCLKNLIVTYTGMFIGGDYIFSWPNFIGLNISVAGSLWYSYITFLQKESAPRARASPLPERVDPVLPK